jgi:hypothetical protein
MGRLSDAKRNARLAEILAGHDTPPPDWRRMLRSVQATAPMLLDSDDPRAERAVRHRLAHAIAFAGCSVHASVQAQETFYATMRGWIDRTLDSTEPATLPYALGPRLPHARDACETGLDWARHVPLAAIRDAYNNNAPGGLASLIRANVRGLGIAKAPYAAALFGDREAACIDTHGLVDVLGMTFEEAERTRSHWRNRHGPADYAAKVRRAFGERDVAMAQWERFATLVPAFARSGHAMYFEAIGIGAA